MPSLRHGVFAIEQVHGICRILACVDDNMHVL